MLRLQLAVVLVAVLGLPGMSAATSPVVEDPHGHTHDAHGGHDHGGQDTHGGVGHDHGATAEAHGQGEHGDHGDHGSHGAAAQGEEHGGDEPLNVANFSYKKDHLNPPLILALINFALLIALLMWKAAPPIRKFALNKHEAIKAGLEEGARLQAEANKKLEEYNQRIAKVDDEVDALIKETRDQAAVEKERILADAKAQVAAVKKAADERIAAEIGLARRELERDVVAAAVAAAETVIREKTTASDQQTLVDNFLGSLEAQARGSAGTTEGRR